MAQATRTRRNATAVKEAAEEPEGSDIRQPSKMHELMAQYFNDTYDAGVTPLQCAIFTSKRTEFRRSDAYQDYRAEENGDAGDEAEAKPVRRTRRGAKAAAEPEEEPAEAAPKTSARRAPRRGAKAAAAAEEPAEEAKPAAKPRRSRRSGATGEDAAPAKPAPRRSRRNAAPEASSEDEPF